MGGLNRTHGAVLSRGQGFALIAGVITAILVGAYLVLLLGMTPKEDQRKASLTGPDAISARSGTGEFLFKLTDGNGAPMKEAKVEFSLDTSKNTLSKLGQVAGVIASIDGRTTQSQKIETTTDLKGEVKVGILLEVTSGGSGSLKATFKEGGRDKSVTAKFKVE